MDFHPHRYCRYGSAHYPAAVGWSRLKGDFIGVFKQFYVDRLRFCHHCKLGQQGMNSVELLVETKLQLLSRLDPGPVHRMQRKHHIAAIQSLPQTAMDRLIDFVDQPRDQFLLACRSYDQLATNQSSR